MPRSLPGQNHMCQVRGCNLQVPSIPDAVDHGSHVSAYRRRFCVRI